MTGPGVDVGAHAAPDGDVWARTFAHSPVGMALVALDGTWLQVNPALCRMLGHRAEHLMRLTFQHITHPDDLQEDLGLLQECLAGERDGYRIVKRYVHADGGLVWGDLSVGLVCDRAGAPLHFVSQILDISEQRAGEARLEMLASELRAANADLEQFAAVISHELKTPLASVKASLELLVDQLGAGPSDAAPSDAGRDDEAAGRVGWAALPTLPQALAARAEAATERMGALIDALLAYTTTDPRRRSGATWEANAAAVSLPDVLDAALADVQVMLARSETTVLAEPGLGEAPAVLGSAPLVRTLLVNLVSNAVKYREPSRPLTVHVEAGYDPADEALVRVVVRNDGPAIPTDALDQVFELFTRGDDTVSGARAGDVAGFGIGLAACRRIVTWHGGRIEIANLDDDAGVRVAFTLPRAWDTTPGPRRS